MELTGWRRPHRILQEEGDSPAADLFRKMPSSGSLNTLRMSLRRRLPLGQVDFNIDHTPSWESLEALSNKPSALQSLGRTARNTWGSVSQKLQKRRQSRNDCLVVTPSKPQARRRYKSGSASKKSTPPRTPRSREGRNRSSTSSVSHTPEEREASRLFGKDGLPLRRSIRSAALKSPYASPTTGISRRRKQAIENYHHIMSENMRLSKIQAQKLLTSSVRRKAKRLCSTVGSWADEALASIAERGKDLN
ncbi:protein PIMREG-like isoform X3 [Scyliorhinus torazame]|uniref:protein PIMREG-like isoform X3 n=1 Tax=Scyliorhinus torazame TaxID=75743 RepID=UPI003B5B3EF2